MLLLLACLAPDTLWESTYSGSIDLPDSGRDTVVPDSVVDSNDSDTVDSQGPEIIVVYAVRHAEKASGSNPGLTEEGQARALALAEKMADIELEAVYATEFLRTQETVQPTADAKGLEVITDIEPKEELPVFILENHGSHTLLHAGHSFTLMPFMENLGLEDPPSLAGYGQIWILTVTDGVVTVEMDSFGG